MLKKILSENLKKFVFKYTNIGKPKYQYNIDPLQLTEIIISLEKVKNMDEGEDKYLVLPIHTKMKTSDAKFIAKKINSFV